jgi:hypothetical protein
MPGPQTSPDALAWAKDAISNGKHWFSEHCAVRLRERRITHRDAKHAIMNASRCTGYDGTPQNGGTCWRIEGPTLDATDMTVGVETYLDIAKRIVVITVF